jgi:hypothetical protein
MAQFLQHVPCIPMLQGFMFSALSKIVSTPSSCERAIISCVATSIEALTGSANFGVFAFFSFFSSAIRDSSKLLFVRQIFYRFSLKELTAELYGLNVFY